MKVLSMFMSSIFILISSHVMITEAFSCQTLKGFHTKLHSIKQQVETNNDKSLSKPSPISMNLDELTQTMNGKGKAQLCWDCFKIGIDPLHFFHPNYPPDELDQTIHNLVSTTCMTQSDILQYIPVKRQSQTLGMKSLLQLQNSYTNPLGIESSIAQLVQITQSTDGTTKLLLKLVGIENYIESVIIPNEKWGKSTLCVSSQVGCAQGCVFCATGKMGRLASLTSDEILIQLYYANKVVRCFNNGGGVGSSSDDMDDNDVDGGWSELPTIDNIVFMGMGEAGDNIDSVQQAVKCMTDRSCFGLAPSKITISTVGPSPDVFEKLTQADAVLAWSVHAANDELRKKLVPTTKYSMEELKDGVIKALCKRSKRLRNLMLEITLMDGINDGLKEAEELADFALDIQNRVEGIKLMVNLIPFNDIGYEQYRRASDENIASFQKVLVGKGVKTYIRTTRGDEENSACGQLATKKRRNVL
ncbi:hypothetical protein CTEN210_07259 [Chaetoceros tenuissimus]|uniref:Radical SAM core domain-containing protein n=1 Tax=Chaetoceros tenuissimus TaxID=426638 RepID=A0AAD3CCE7_9STRA|nr:hypothetical protein CTEN210_00010 [Chaetoceros tenuissimus]GFH50783.1 hypothetical protein CTEN210_07259 [Chaetoceros tenuissimus]